ncbi:PRC-barrel domain-containing protein [Algoriphagus aquimarinus]|uniref:PRC-barrel domain-containing protein n=1 Tax=Algoriphagus aquimarinus TaxID=237018 RepID=A0A1I1AM69_9BACT|nr:PRC-barrel domain-containing protein [Algoriphagus aquimarinus]SFB38466.1 PRC-barrel domain-containing protein [Algoriphagus aquimarinus]|tara:strand:- start:189848 stop:190378 length:531 start_codon:yes stop_codon:yes gene_type:complete
MNNSLHSQISSSTATSCKVKTARDESVGSIKDIMINTSTGQVDYVVLKVDEGFLNLGSKLLALPFESFEFNPKQDDVIIVKEIKETLENAPGFDEDNWPSGPQAEFIHDMRTFYSEESRSLYGRYDHVNRSYYNDEDRFDMQSTQIRDRQSGDGFLEMDHRGQRQSDIRRGGDPLL